MHIEHLSKSQIVLLTLLVSFVTSIATGIVTVSLMEQAPPAVAQTVNRVIERTVEKVVPSGQSAATVITREKTVVVKESELISQAVDRASPALVRISEAGADSPQFLGLGVMLDGMGVVATDASVLTDRSDAILALSDGSQVRGFVVARDAEAGVAYLQSATTTSDGKTPSFSAAVLAGSRPVLGQTVITLSGRTITKIGNGIITALVDIKGEKGVKQILETTIPSDVILRGALLLNTEGQILGMSTWVARRDSDTAFISSSALKR